MMLKRILACGLAIVLSLCAATTASALEVGEHEYVVTKSDGSVWSFYTSASSDPYYKDMPFVQKVMDDVASVHDNGSFGVNSDNNLYIWHGYRFMESKAKPDETAEYLYKNIVQAYSGDSFAIFVVKSGNLYTYGDHPDMMGGNNSYDYEPKKMMENVAQLSVGLNHVLALNASGNLYGWGNTSGKKDFYDDYSAVERQRKIHYIMNDIQYVSAGMKYSMVIKKDGSLWGWGQNAYGQLGDGTTESRENPVKIMEDVVEVAAGSGCTLAIKSDGSLWAWGANWRGQLGDGSREDKLRPTKVMDDVAHVITGDEDNMVIKKDGSLWLFGLDEYKSFHNSSSINPEIRLSAAGVPVEKIKPIEIYIDGYGLRSDVPPEIINDRVMIPLSVICMSLGMEVSYDQQTRTVTATGENRSVTHVVGETKIIANGKEFVFDTPSVIVSGRTLVPVRMFAEAFDMEVEWQPDARTVTITSK